jgi:hypothetical protein
MMTARQEDQVGEKTEANYSDDPVEILLRLASRAQLCRSAEGRLYAEVEVGEHHVISELRSPRFRDWLINGYFDQERRPPSTWAVRRVVSTLEAVAGFDATTPSVFVRVGRDAGSGHDAPACYLDLGNGSGQAVKIRNDGWHVVDRPAVRFRRPEGLLPLPTPSHQGSIDLLRPYVNLSEQDFRLLIIWLTAALRLAGPYPILVLYGEQGSAKSTLAKLVRLLIDPQSCSLLAQPRSTRELISTAVNGWLLAYDNLSVMPDWLSDSLCRLADGAGFGTSAVSSGDEQSKIHAQRPVVLNGIEEFVRRGDLSARCVFLRLPPIPPTSRRSEQEYWASFKYDYPRMLGGLLDAVVGGLRVLPTIDLPTVPRMADFAYWGEAASRGLGWAPDLFLSVYTSNRREATEEALQESAVGAAILELARGLRQWSGTAAELHDALTTIVGKNVAASARWPKTSSWLSKELRRISSRLGIHGLSISFDRKYERRIITLTTHEEPGKSASGTTPIGAKR